MNAEAPNYFVLFVNVFLTPVISLWLASRRPNFQSLSALRIFMRYALYVVANLIVTHVPVAAVRVLFNRFIFNDGVTYTVLAVVAAILISIAESFFVASDEPASDESAEERNDL